jgi:two-component system, cell cycle sensor histidine kinase and response regulator CckA
MSAGFEAAGNAYRLLFERAGEMVCLLDVEGRFLDVNAAGEQLTGYPASELVGRFAVELIAPELRGEAVRQFRARLDDGRERPPDETVLIARDGRRVPIEVRSTFFEVDGRPVGVLGLVADRTAKEDAREALRRSEERLRGAEARFRAFFEFAPIGEAIVATDGRFLEVNSALCEILGYPKAELVAKTFQDLTHPDDLAADLELVRQTLEGKRRSFHMAKRYLHPLGRIVWAHLSVSLVREADGEPSYFISQIQDITEQRNAQEAVAQSEARLAEAQHIVRVGSWEADFATGAIAISQELSRLFEIAPERTDVRLEDLLERIHPDDHAMLHEANARAQKTNANSDLEYRIVLGDGGLRWIHARAEPLVVDGNVVGRRGTSQDITERKQAEQQLAEAEHRYRTLVEQLPLATYVRPLDMTRPNIYVSPQVEPMLGYPAAEWQSDPGLLARIVHPDDRDRVLSAAAGLRETGAPVRDEYRYVTPDGRVVWVQDETYRVVGETGDVVVQGFLLDITERKRAEAERDRLDEQFHQAQKLEAVGQLAGGIAHDFNNMLTAIKGYSELLLNELQPGTAAHAEASQIQRAAERAATLPSQLLAFGRAQPLEPRLFDLDALVAGTTALLEHLLSEAIELVVEPAAETIFVQVDSARVETALVNLALNARDAMPDGGTLTIMTGVVELHEEEAREQQIAPGSYSVISVVDSGQGMDAETAARAFEPFFTTKPHGEGSGLGLASVYGTVRQSGGFVSLESEPGAGTTINLHLPAANRPAGAPPRSEVGPSAAQASPTAAAGPGEGRVVLVAEDEDVVRELVVRILRRDGYRVHAAARGTEALGLLNHLDSPIDVLLTDMVMPGMGGRELAEQVLERRPGTPVVFMSGYTEDAPTLDAGRQPSSFLTKPFSSTALREAVARALPQGIASIAAEPSANGLLSCVIVDDHPTVLDAVSRHLEAAGVHIVGRVRRADLALEQIEAHQPATALIDIAIEPFDGIELAGQAAAVSPQTGIVLYTGRRDPELLRRALDSGVRGFVVKDAPLSEVLSALTAVRNGEHHIDPALAAELMGTPPAEPLPRLTSREQQVLELIATGNTNERAAAELGISPETVQSHVKNVMHKLDAETRTQAVATALRHSLIR